MVEKPPQHSLLRLRDYPPDLQDLLIVSSTASPDIGLLSRSKKPLATDKPAASITGVFTTTELLDDSRRPTLPMTDSMDDSTPIGFALDLSSKDKVYKPIPSEEELEESPNPLPGLWILTHEGVLCSWWVIYNDAVKQGKPYPGLTEADTSSSTQPTPASPFAASGNSAFGSPSAAPVFGSSASARPAFGSSAQLGPKSSPWGAPSVTSPSHTGGSAFEASPFGNASTSASSGPAFGQASTPGFGQSTQLGPKPSPWSSGTSAFGNASTPAAPTPSASSGLAFGQASTPGLGQSAQPGAKASPWAPGGGGNAAPSFGQSGFASFANKTPNASPWGQSTETSKQPTEAPASGGFAGFASGSTGGFASLASNKTGGSVFGGGNETSASPFGSAKTEDTAFPPRTEDKPAGGVFGSQPFQLQSSFKASAIPTEDDAPKASSSGGQSLFGNAFGSALNDTEKKDAPAGIVQDDNMDSEAPAVQPPQTESKSLFGKREEVESTTPTSTPAPSKFTSSISDTPGSSLFGKPTPAASTGGGLFASKTQSPFGSGSLFGKSKDSTDTVTEPETPKNKHDELEAPLPPDTTTRLAYPLGDSSSSSAASNPPIAVPTASSPPRMRETSPQDDPLATPKPKQDIKLEKSESPESHTPESVARGEASSPTDFVQVSNPKNSNKERSNAVANPPATASKAPPSIFSKPSGTGPSKPTPIFPSSLPPLDSDDSDSDEESATEGSGVDVAKDLSPGPNGLGSTPGFTPQSSFGGMGSAAATNATQAQTGGPSARPLFGEFGRNAPLFPPATTTSPRSPSPVRRPIPSRLSRTETRSVSAPGIASKILGAGESRNRARSPPRAVRGADDPFIAQTRREKARKEIEETQPLVDEEDDEIQRLLASEVEGTLELHEFVAHSNSGPPAKESIPSQVEAVYRDINSMIDTIGLNARSVTAFTKGHSSPSTSGRKTKHDLENADDWVLCEVDALGNVLDMEVGEDLESGRVQDLEDKLDTCKDLAKDMHRLRAKREDLSKLLMVKLDPDQAQAVQSMPLSAEQAAQQNELRKEFASFSNLLVEAEEALTVLKAKIASLSGASGRGNTAVPTVEAVMRTITKMTTMVEKRSGDIDVLENQMRKMNIASTSREGSPMVTPQARRSVMFSPDSTPARTLRHSFAASVGSIGSPARGTPSPRKKVSGFNQQEKGELMSRRKRRSAVLATLRANVENKGPVQVLNMDDVE